MALPVALCLGALGVMMFASVANATHARPKAASPIVASMVPAYNACGAPNRQHGPPLAFPSCNPPVQSSGSITVGTPDANGAAANSVGSIRLAVIQGAPGPPDDSDVSIKANITDVRCKAGTAACGAANAAGGADYTGEVQGNALIRITDHFNAVAPGGGTDAATVIDVPFPVNASCTGTASTAIGGTCDVVTTANAVVPAAVKDAKRAIVEISQLQVLDGGPDGTMGTAPNTLAFVQGIFIP
jgi:hypothetical protein